MEAKKKIGIDITEADGTPLSSGLQFYWDADLSRILMQEASDFCPDVKFKQKNTKAFETRFFKDTDKGVELCGTSKSLEDKHVRIPESDLDKFIKAIDQLHAKSKHTGIPADNKTFMRDFVVPNPLSMKSAWRVTTGFSQRLLVLWGYTAPSSNAVVLPLTPTSAKWDDASKRVNLKDILSKADRLSKHKFNWRKFFKWILYSLLALLLLLLLYLSIPWVIRPCGKCNICNTDLQNGHCPNVCSIHSNTHLTPAGKCPKYCPKHPDIHLDKNNICPICGAISVCDVCGTPLTNGKCPNICNVHQDTHFNWNGKCPKYCPKHPEVHLDKNNVCSICGVISVCNICGSPLKDGKCPNICDIHPDTHLDKNGKCPQYCPKHPDIHLDKNNICPICGAISVCDVCGTPLTDGKCPNICSVHQDTHFYWNGKCPKYCPKHPEIHLDKNNVCSICGVISVCNICGSPLKDGKCPNICDIHPDTHLDKNGKCPKYCSEHPEIHLDKHNKCLKCSVVIDTCKICGSPLKDGKCPNICDIHQDTHLDKNGKCPKYCQKHTDIHLDKNNKCSRCDKVIDTCKICGSPLKDGKCPNICDIHQDTHFNWNGKCPKYCSTHTDIHLDKDNKCPKCDKIIDTCHLCGSPLKDGKCPNICDIHPDTHLDKNGKCPKYCSEHPEIHLDKDNKCPKCDKIIDTCHLCGSPLKDGKCPNICDIHPDTHLDKNGKCPKYCSEHPEIHLDKHNKCLKCGVVIDTCKICGSPLKDGKCPNICDIHQDTHLDKNGKCPKYCPKHTDTHLDKNNKCPKCDVVIDTCKICGSPLKDGKCPNICDIHQDTHLDKNGKCTKYCPKHTDIHLDKDNKCLKCESKPKSPINDQPKKCPICNTELQDNKCPNICKKCNREHLKEGKCPTCDVPEIAAFTFAVKMKQKQERGNVADVTFCVEPDRSIGNTSYVVHSWIVNGEIKNSGNKKEFLTNLSYKKRYVISAVVTVNGKEQKVLPFQWNCIDTPVWMITRVGNNDKEYQVLCTNSSTTRFKVVKWDNLVFQNAKKEDISKYFKCTPPIPFSDTKAKFSWSQEHIGEYIIFLQATIHVLPENGQKEERINIQDSFVFMNGSITQALISLKYANAKDRIYHCLATNIDGSQHNGTAFAVTDKLLLTNYHVAVGSIPEYYKGEETKVNPSKPLVLSNEKEMFYARVVKADRATDMALLKVCDQNGYDTDKVLSKHFAIAKSIPQLNTRVFSVGYPAGTTKFGAPAFSDGKIEHCEVAGKRGEIIFHFSNIQPGYSGGPLVDMDNENCILGVNTCGITTGTPLKQGVNVATSAAEIRKIFPEIFNVGH